MPFLTNLFRRGVQRQAPAPTPEETNARREQQFQELNKGQIADSAKRKALYKTHPEKAAKTDVINARWAVMDPEEKAKADKPAQRERNKEPESPEARQRKWIRKGWGVANVRTTRLVQIQKKNETWHTIFGKKINKRSIKFFRFSYRTNDQVIGAVAMKVGINEDGLKKRRDKFSKARPDDGFSPVRISRTNPPDLCKKLGAKLIKINGLGFHKDKYLTQSSEFIRRSNPKQVDDLVTFEMSKIHGELVKKNDAFLSAIPASIDEYKRPHRPTPENHITTLQFAMLAACKDIFDITEKQVSETTIARALDYLTKLPLLGAAMSAPAINEEGKEHEYLAWRIAYKMAATPLSFDVLKKINTTISDYYPDITAAEDISSYKRKNIRRDENMRLFLQGADKLLQDEKSPQLVLKTDPGNLLEYCNGQIHAADRINQNTLLINALPGIKNEILKNELTTPAEIEAHPKVKMWAARALRNGFLTDVSGSPFAKTNARLQKVSLQVTRGLKNKGITEDAATKAASNLAYINEPTGKLNNFLRRLKRNGGKSPFNQTLYSGMATNGSLLQREKMTAALRLLDRALTDDLHGEIHTAASGANLNFKNINFGNTVTKEKKLENIEKIARIIYVRCWAEESQAEVLDGRPLSYKSSQKLLKDDYLLNLLPPNFDIDLLKILKNSIIKETSSPLTHGLLENWHNTVDYVALQEREVTGRALAIDPLLPASGLKAIPDATNIRAMLPSQYKEAFKNAYDHLEKGEDNDKITLPERPNEELSSAGIGKYLSKQAQRMRLGSSIKFSDGSAIGIGLQGLTAVVGRAFLGGVFGIRANLSHSRSRNATLEFGVNAASGFARFGVESTRRNRVGTGASAGWTIGKFKNFLAGVGAYSDIKGIYDSTKFTGVTLRLDRLGSDVTGREGQLRGVAGDADMTVKLGKTLEKVINGPKIGQGQGNLLQQLLEDNAGLSVSWLDDNDSTSRDLGGTGQAGAVAGAYASGVGIGPSLSVASTGVHQTTKYEEHTGGLRSRVIGSSNRHTVNAQVAAVGLVNLGLVSGHSIVAKETAAVGDLKSGNAEIYRDGTREEIRTVEYNGELQPTTYKLIIHANAESFATKVEQDIEEWGQRFAEIKQKEDTFDVEIDDPEINEKRLAATKNQAGVVRDLMQKVRETAHPNTAYIEYLELAEETTIEINRYKHMAKMAEMLGERGEHDRQVFLETAESLLKNPHSYVRRFLFTTATKVSDEGRNINFIGSYSTTNQVYETVMLDGYIG